MVARVDKSVLDDILKECPRYDCCVSTMVYCLIPIRFRILTSGKVIIS